MDSKLRKLIFLSIIVIVFEFNQIGKNLQKRNNITYIDINNVFVFI